MSKELSKQDLMTWLNADDLPPVETAVLIWYSPYIGIGFYAPDFGGWVSDEYEQKPVTHWMPLPDAPVDGSM